MQTHRDADRPTMGSSSSSSSSGREAGTSELVAREVEVDQLAEVTHVIQVVEAVVGERESDEGG
jgi:hypothetical protein